MKIKRMHIAFTKVHYYYGYVLVGLAAFSVIAREPGTRVTDFAVCLSTIAFIHLIVAIGVLRRKNWARWGTLLVMFALLGLAATSAARVIGIAQVLTGGVESDHTSLWALLQGLFATAVTAGVVISFATMLLIFPIVALIYYNLPPIRHQFDR